MLRLAITAAAPLLAGCASAWISPIQSSLNAAPGEPAELPGEIRDGWVIVEASVNGRGPFRFLLDTGANFSVITSAAAREAGIEAVDKANIQDIAGNRHAYPLGWADGVEAGPVSLRRMPFVITDNLEDAKGRLGVVGLLGYPGFDRFTLDLDYPAGTVRVSDAPIDPRAPGVTPLRRLHNETPEISVALLDERGIAIDERWFAIDSGGSAILHVPSTMTRWVDADLAVMAGGGRGLSGAEHENPLAPLRGPIRLGATTVERAAGETETPRTLIGHQILRQFRVRLDPVSGLAALVPPDPATNRITALQYGGIGINMGAVSDGELVLTDVAPGSPAARAGLRHGDRVLAVDGVPVGDPAFIDRTRWMFDPPPRVALLVRRGDQRLEIAVPTEPLFPPNPDPPVDPD